MRVIRSLPELETPPAAAVVTVGNFDGVHLAHQQLLRGVSEKAKPLGALAVAVTFDRHPRQLLSPGTAPRLLTSLDRKIPLIQRQGIELLVILPFTEELARLSPLEFVRDILQEKLHAVSVHVGSNFRFGHRHAGDVHVLRDLAGRMGFRVEVLPELRVRGEQVSSTRIRELLAEGRVQTAGRLLGRPFSVLGPVARGLGVGHAQTVPTLNLVPEQERSQTPQLPKPGVYVTRTRVTSQRHESVTNVGYKPTFGEHPLTIESHLLNFHIGHGGQGGLKATEMEVEFLHRLRDEVKFPDAVTLKNQIQKDAGRALKFFRLLDRFRTARKQAG